MLKAVISHNEQAAIVELPMDRLSLQYELSQIGIRRLAKDIPIMDEEDQPISVKLYSEADIGQNLAALFRPSHSLEDANVCAHAVVHARPEVQHEIEQSIVYGQYHSPQAVLADIQAMTADLIAVTVNYYCPLQVRMTDEEYGDWYGMVRDDSVLTAELVYAGQEISITSTSVAVFNERQKVEVKLYKDLEKDELFQIGSGDEILHVYFALYAAEDLTAADGSVIPADGLIEIAGVQADGTLVFASDLPIGSYYVKEYAVDAQYLISEETYPITFTYEDDTTAVVRIEVNNGEAILNRIIRGSITGIKVDEQGEPLPGAVFGLFRADCTDFTEENALLTAESAEDGSFSFENIPYGVWLVREIATSEGYVLSDEIFTVQVSENGAVIELGNLENKPITGELELTKKDISDGKLLPGAGFRIKDADGNVVAEGYTDENGIAKFTLRYGKYTYEEFDAPEGYRIDTTPHEFEITEDGQIVKAEMTNEKIPTPDVPQTGDESNLGFWIGLGSIALGGAIACGILFAKRKKDDDSDE